MPMTSAPVSCACCRRPIESATVRFPSAHAACWRVAGGKVKRVSVSKVVALLDAEYAAWLAAYEAEDARLSREAA